MNFWSIQSRKKMEELIFEIELWQLPANSGSTFWEVRINLNYIGHIVAQASATTLIQWVDLSFPNVPTSLLTQTRVKVPEEEGKRKSLKIFNFLKLSLKTFNFLKLSLLGLGVKRRSGFNLSSTTFCLCDLAKPFTFFEYQLPHL